MEFVETKLSGVTLIKPKIFSDDRGFFYESYKKSEFMNHGIDVDFVQDNHSKSSKGVLRGLHYQLAPNAQAKLVRCVVGAVFDVVVDIRVDSKTFGQWVGYELSSNNKHMLFIPEGFAHGFLTLEDNTEFLYKTSGYYSPQSEGGIRFDDPEIGVVWPYCEHYIMSPKDKAYPSLNKANIKG